MKKDKKITLCIGTVLVLLLGFILGLNASKLVFNSGKKIQKNMIAMYIQNEGGGYDLNDNQSIFPTIGYKLNMEKSTCKNGGTLTQNPDTKKLSLSVSNKDECTVYFDKTNITSSEILTVLGKSSKGVKTSFDTSAITDEGVFEMEDDYGTSYYYRGAVEDNYVKYGVNKDGQEMWWRIIRINGDGSIRILYDGTQGYTNGTTSDDRFAIVNQPFNTSYDDAKYLGWMYGPANGTEGTTTASTSKDQAQSNMVDSDIKKVVDIWYKENIVDTGYGVNVSDEIFCNDRMVVTDPITGSNGNYTSYNFTTEGFGSNPTLYQAYSRLGYAFSIRKPIFTCPQKNDAFTVDDTTKGNGALTYPVGLITADEVTAAGSMSWDPNPNYYLNKNAYYYTMTPWYFHTSKSSTIMYALTDDSRLSYAQVNRNLNIDPVINLSAEYASKLVGTGTISDPYRAT